MSTSADTSTEQTAPQETQPKSSADPSDNATPIENAAETAALVSETEAEAANATVDTQAPDARESAATRISSAFRGHAVRLHRKRQEAAATDIQRIARGNATRAQAQKLIRRHRLLERDTEARQQRLRRIKALERDLRLYRSIAPHQIFDVERMKKAQCAKIIQRTWRRFKGLPMTKFESVVDMMLEQHFTQAENESKRKQFFVDGLFQTFAAMEDQSAGQIEGVGPVDPIRLDALKRKFRAAAEDKNAAVPARSKYHVFHETQQAASSLLGQYSLSKAMLGRRQAERVQRTRRCATLLEQLAKPPQLQAFVNDGSEKNQDAPVTEWLNEPTITGSRSDFEKAADSHIRSASAFDDAHKWWVASVPENIDGPPLDIRELAEKSKQPIDIAAQLGTHDPGADSLESLWWISFARKRFVMTSNADDADSEPRFSYAQIDGSEEVQKLAKDTFKLAFSAETARIQETREEVAQYHQNVEKLSNALHRAWLRQVADQRSTGYRAQSTKRKEDAATKIQATARGRFARKRARALQAEKRIMQALGSLLNELNEYPKDLSTLDAVSNPIEALRLKLLGNQN